jgi:AcrR family transcriptional regulator
MRVKTSKEKMLKAALRVFSKKGYNGSSVTDIITEAKVARGTFYLYFQSKRNAFEQVLAFIISEMNSQVPQTEPGTKFPTAEAVYNKIYTTNLAFLNFFHMNRLFARIVFTEALSIDKGFEKQMEALYESFRAKNKRFINCVRDSGLARSFNIDIVTEAIIGYMERCALTFLSRKKIKVTIEQLAQELSRLEFKIVCNVSTNEIGHKE